MKVPAEIYELISADIKASINSIYCRGIDCYEVSYGINNCSAYYHIVDNKIVSVQFD